MRIRYRGRYRALAQPLKEKAPHLNLYIHPRLGAISKGEDHRHY